MRLPDFVSILNLAIGPAILISGNGLLLLSLTTRFGRAIDRARFLVPELDADDEASRRRIMAQLRILARRARALRTAITLVVVSLLCDVLLVLGLFAAAAAGADGRGVALALTACFGSALAALIAALVVLLYDLNLSLRALWLEIPAECRRFGGG